ncbi:MAG: ferrous iron transport protein A [Youngiibacter sp.]|jgi:ferrous iron transport protein A|nr:ferrous iron transport protein A [Youngiibacter sp.]
MCLTDIKPGGKAMIEGIGGNEKLAKRLLALGCTEGCEIEVVRKAPLGDPLVLSLRGFHIALRKADAKNILVRETI